MAKLILVRHGLSIWNKEGRWQGKTDVSLSDEGRKQIDAADEAIRGMQIDKIYTSPLSRVKESEWIIVNDLGLSCPVVENSALDERDYGIYTGRNKWEVEKELGEEEFEKIRRGWNTPIPGGENLEDVFNRVVPFYQQTVLPDLKAGKNVLIVSSGNTLRALIKYLENLSIKEVEELDLDFAEIIIYDVDATGKAISSQIPRGLSKFPGGR